MFSKSSGIIFFYKFINQFTCGTKLWFNAFFSLLWLILKCVLGCVEVVSGMNHVSFMYYSGQYSKHSSMCVSRRSIHPTHNTWQDTQARPSNRCHIRRRNSQRGRNPGPVASGRWKQWQDWRSGGYGLVHWASNVGHVVTRSNVQQLIQRSIF